MTKIPNIYVYESSVFNDLNQYYFSISIKKRYNISFICKCQFMLTPVYLFLISLVSI